MGQQEEGSGGSVSLRVEERCGVGSGGDQVTTEWQWETTPLPSTGTPSS